MELDTTTQVEDPTVAPAMQSPMGDLYANEIDYKSPFTDSPKRDIAPKGFGEVVKFPSPKDITVLRANQADPDAIKAYDYVFGAGSANRVLNLPSQDDINKLLAQRNDPEAVKTFDAIYGDISRPIIELYDPKSDAWTRESAASTLRAVLEGYPIDPTGSRVGDYATSAVRGALTGVQEVVQSASAGIDYLAGTKTNVPDLIGKTDTRAVADPITNALISGVSQFLTGQAIMTGATGGIGSGLSGVAQGIRQLSLGALTDSLAFDPNDPLIGDALRAFGMKRDWFTDLSAIERHETEIEKRLARAGEGAVVGAVIGSLLYVVKAYRARKAGKLEEAEALKEQAAKQLEEAAGKTPEPVAKPTEPRPEFNLPQNMEIVDSPNGVDKTLRLKNVPDSVSPDPVDGTIGRQGISFSETEDGVRIAGSYLPSSARGQGDGKALYKAIADYAESKGKVLYSDFDLSTDALRMYDYLKSMGYNVVRSKDFREGVNDGYSGKFIGGIDSEGNKTDGFTIRVIPKEVPMGYTAAEVASTGRISYIKDNIADRSGPNERAIKQALEGPLKDVPQVPATVRSLLDNIPDFTNYSYNTVRAALAPLMDDVLNIAKTTPDILERIMRNAFTPEEWLKLQPLISRAVAATERDIAGLKDTLDVLKKARITDAAKLDETVAKIKDANDLLSNLQKVDYPLSNFSGLFLNLRKIEQRISMANKVDIDALRAAGKSEEQIAKAIAAAVDTLDTTRLTDLSRQKDAANATGRLDLVKQLDEQIAKELADLEKKASGGFKNLYEQIVKDTVNYTISSILSGFGTTIRNIFGATGHVLLDRFNRIAGLVRQYGPTEGVQAYLTTRTAERMALKSGFDGYLDAMSTIFKDAAKNTFNDTSKTAIAGMVDGQNPTRIQGANYGLTGTSKAVVDTIGRGVELLTFPLRMSDEVLSDIFSRHTIGNRAAFRFMSELKDQSDLIAAKLRDPNLDAATKAKLEAELAQLKGPKPTVDIDGQRVTLEDLVKQSVDGSYSAEGKLINKEAINDTNYLLLRQRQTNALGGKALEELLNSRPEVKFLIPIFNAPLNGFKAGMDTIPGIRAMPFLTDFRAELASLDPVVQNRALGKFYTGYAITGTALFLADQGIITYEPLRDRNARLSAQSSSSVGPYKLHIFGRPVDITGLDPISVPLVWAAVFTHSLKDYNSQLAHRQEILLNDPLAAPMTVTDMNLKRMADLGFAVMGATGSAIVDQPVFSGAKDIVDILMNISSAAEKENAAKEEFVKAGRNQVSKFVPNAFKQVNSLLDPNRYDPRTFLDMIQASAGFTAQMPMLYDVTGQPIQNKTPARSMLGPLAPTIVPDKGDKATIVKDTLDNMGKITGHYYVFDTSPPESLLKKDGVDLRVYKAMSDDRKVVDVFAKHYRTLELNGMTVTDSLYNILKESNQVGLSVGNKLVDGSVYKALTAEIDRYKKAAWFLTVEDEITRAKQGINKELLEKINNAGAMSNAAQDWRKDFDPTRANDILTSPFRQ